MWWWPEMLRGGCIAVLAEVPALTNVNGTAAAIEAVAAPLQAIDGEQGRSGPSERSRSGPLGTPWS